MEDQLLTYFTAEKNEAGLFMAVGVAAIGAGVWLLLTGGSYKGMAYPLIAIAAIQLVVGAAVYFRSDGQLAALQVQQREAPAAFKAGETARMTPVIANFKIYKAIEIGLLALGIALTFALGRSDLWYAIGIGLIVQSALMLVLDLFAERRADEYLKFVLGVGNL